MNHSPLQLRCDRNALGISSDNWKSALLQAQLDPVVGIRHAALSGDAQYRLHVAAIPTQVGCHFHLKGDEDYAIVSGQGTLHWGKVRSQNGVHEITWETPLDVQVGDRFVIPAGYAHQLRKRGHDELVIVFGCPDSHLDNTKDRTLLSDAPTPSADSKRAL